VEYKKCLEMPPWNGTSEKCNRGMAKSSIMGRLIGLTTVIRNRTLQG
jgi:hypothetical protein